MGAYEGVPMRCFCHVCLKGGGGDCPCAQAHIRYFSYTDPKRYLNCFQMVPQQTCISLVCAFQQFLLTPLWGRGVLGVICIKYTQHPGILSLGYLTAPGLGASVPAGMCACVVPYRDFPPGTLGV